MWEIIDHLHSADGHTVAVAAVGVDGGEHLFDDAHLASGAAAPFFMDHAALFINLFGIEQKLVRPVM